MAQDPQQKELLQRLSKVCHYYFGGPAPRIQEGALKIALRSAGLELVDAKEDGVPHDENGHASGVQP